MVEIGIPIRGLPERGIPDRGLPGGVGVEEVTILVAAPGEGVTTRIRSLLVSIGSFYGNAVVSIDDGTTTYWKWDASDGGRGQPPMLNFGHDGFYWGKNKAVRLVSSDDNVVVNGAVDYYCRG